MCLHMAKSAILIPAYCPNEKLIELIEKLLKHREKNLYVVDDGSGDKYTTIFDKLEKEGICVLTHPENRGKGAAIKTGIYYIMEQDKQVNAIITVDADGQHSVEDIIRVEQESKEKGELVLGVRNFDGEEVPKKSRWGNYISSLYFRWNTKQSCPDTQTGLRAIPKKLFAIALTVPGDRYEYEMNFLLEVAKCKQPIRYVPIQTIYEDYNATSHFQPIKDSIRIFQKPIRYFCTAVASSAIDLVLFWIIKSILWNAYRSSIFLATVGARICSGCFNYYRNRTWSFSSSNEVHKEAWKYLLLFIAQMLLSGSLLTLAKNLTIPTIITKIIIDSILFLISYVIQSRWVFAGKTKK